MGYGHSLDPRRRIIAAVEAVALAREAGRRFEVSASSAVNLVRRWRETGSLAPGQIGGQKKRRLSGYEDWLHEVMATMPDITLSELQSRLAAMDAEISMQAINTTLYALGYRLKTAHAARTRARRRGSQAPSLAQPADLA